MRIRYLSINNFRGIRQMSWSLPDKRLSCLIGAGDATKSTILEAVRRLFYGGWNLPFDDADFYQCTPENKILIGAVLGELPDEFQDLEKYGHCLCGWDIQGLQVHAEPRDGLEEALRVRLSVGEDLEPAWRVIRNDADEGIPFRASDRIKVAVSMIGAISDTHLTWSRGSLLARLTESENMFSSLAAAGRAAKTALEAQRGQKLAKFDAVAKTAENTARSLGVRVGTSYKAHLDSETINVKMSGLALHDGEMPLRQLGLGSKRMLTTGLQQSNLRGTHITLFDEVEIGLEPHRIARLLHHLKGDITGQYLLTTHSPVVLRELTVDDLHVVHSREGNTEVVATNQQSLVDVIQGKIREGAEAFLAPKIAVCEGATEAGFLRGLDAYWIGKKMNSFAYQGVATFDARGASKVNRLAEVLKMLSYDVSVLADSDEPAQFSNQEAESLGARGVEVILWSGDVCIERRVFSDLPWQGVKAGFEVACDMYSRSTVLGQIQSNYGEGLDRDYEAWADSPRLREALGAAAKTSEWFKRQNKAQLWVGAISRYLDDQSIRDTDLIRKIDKIRQWVDRA
jgi:hypothetical protein